MPTKPKQVPQQTSHDSHDTHDGHDTHANHDTHSVDASLAIPMPGIESEKSGDSILAIAKAHIGEQYILGARAPMGNSNWQGPWDCAEFVSWCVYRGSGILFGVEPKNDPVRADAYTGYWASQARSANAMISVGQAAAIAGAAVLRIPQSGQTGHIVISDGQGGTVEAHSKAKGVCANTLNGRRWDCGILIPGVRYFGSDTPVKVVVNTEVLRLSEPLTRGKRVEAIQACLQKLGYAVGKLDGVYGPQTAWAVQQFQSDHNLVADGEVGKATLAKLKAKRCKVA